MDTIQTVRQLINEGRYSEARTLLVESDHMAAPYWLCKLDLLDPQPKAAKPRRTGLLSMVNAAKAR